MKLLFVSPGKFKSREYRSLCEHYLNLCSAFGEAALLELDLKAREQAELENDLLRWIRKRAGRITITILDERGAVCDSRAFAKKFEKIRDSSPTEWIFLLGTDRGFSAEFKKTIRPQTSLEWSLSNMTMAHELAATVACEQIYRAFTILAKHPYHRD